MNKRKITLVSVFFGLLLLIGIIIAYFALSDSDIVYTENVTNYNTEEHPLPLSVFPSDIPQNAEVISFSYYNYWKEDSDYYLELKFSSTEEMEKYLSDTLENCVEYCKQKRSEEVSSWFLEEKNPYNETYTDLFNISCISQAGNKTYTGYEITANENPDDKNMWYHCNYGVISYSYTDLCVIHAYSCGSFYSDTNNYTPKYFDRFDVFVKKEHRRFLDLTNQGDQSEPIRGRLA